MVIRKCDAVFVALAVLATVFTFAADAYFPGVLNGMNKALLAVMYVTVGATFFYGR